MNNTIDIKSFDITKKYELFTIIYSVSKSFNDNTIKEWIVTGHKLLNSVDKRCFEYILMSYPISEYVSSVQHKNLRELGLECYISSSKEDIIALKKQLINDYFNSCLTNLESSIK